ncbi:MAG: hypothetical protein ACM33T_16100 [Solirubrobacterales bacterium]
MGKPGDVPTDLEWFHALEFSPDDLDEDGPEHEAAPAGSRPAKTGAVSPEPREGDRGQ